MFNPKPRMVYNVMEDYFRNSCIRNDRLDDLYEQIEKKGLHLAWMEYIVHDIEDVIDIEGVDFLMKHLPVASKKKLIDFIKRHY